MSDGPSAPPSGDAHVVIVDDHGLLAQSLAYALRADGLNVERCRELTDEAIVGTVEAEDAEVVLLDLDVGGDLGSTLHLVPRLRETGTHVVMMTGVTDPVRLAECVEAGAVGVIAKTWHFDDLVAAVHRVLRTGTLLSTQDREEHLAALRRHRAADRERLRDFEQLTRREVQVLADLMDGKTADHIADEQVLAVATVRSHIRGVLEKLGVNSQLAAVVYARQAGWSPPE